MIRAESVRDFALCLLFAAFCTAVAIVCFCLGQDREAARGKAREARTRERYRVAHVNALLPGGYMVHIERDSEALIDSAKGAK